MKLKNLNLLVAVKSSFDFELAHKSALECLLRSQSRAGVSERVAGGIIPPAISHPVERTGVLTVEF